MIIYHGSIRKFESFKKEIVIQNLSNDINTIGFWFTSDIHLAKPFAVGTKNRYPKIRNGVLGGWRTKSRAI